MAGRALEHDKPDVKHVEAPQHTSPAHAEVDAAQRAASTGRDSQPKTEPKTLDLSQPIGGTAKEFDSNTTTRGLARDSAAASANAEAKAQKSSSFEPSGSSFSDVKSNQIFGHSINSQTKEFLSQNPSQSFRLNPEQGGKNSLSDDGAQFKLNLNPNFTQYPPSLENGTNAGKDFKHNDGGFTQYPPTPGDGGKDGKAFKQNETGFTQNPNSLEQKSSRNPQVPTNLSDAPLSSSQKAIGQATPETQRAEADSLLQNKPGQSAEQSAQIAANKALVNKFNEGVHRQTLIDKAGSGELGEQGGRVIAGMTESKAFRGEATKLTKD